MSEVLHGHAEVAIAEYLGPIAEDGPVVAAGADGRHLVAVKTLKAHMVESHDEVFGFIEEARVMLHLSHP